MPIKKKKIPRILKEYFLKNFVLHPEFIVFQKVSILESAYINILALNNHNSILRLKAKLCSSCSRAKFRI